MSINRSIVHALAAVCACWFGGSAALAAEPLDEIVLLDGSRVVGTITSARDGELTVDTSFAGTLTIQLDQVESLVTGGPETLLLEDDSVVREQPVRIVDGQIASAVEPSRRYPVSALNAINPEPWELGRGYKWTGLVDFALSFERGNSDTDELDYRLESSWRSVRDRYRILARGENDETDGTETADNWLLRGKWDYFIEDPNYWGFLAQAEQDKFADLDLRWLAGPFIGRQIFDTPRLRLAGEFGASYVTEEFITAEDQDYPAAIWDIDVTSDYLGGDSSLYLRQFGLWNLDETSDVVVDTTLGLSFPLLFRFEAAAEIMWEYDSGAVENVDNLDETYRLRIGYKW
ncbi:MAG: DUF481 domain-containing protein [Halioglobus sp.]|nr:DUF481 domain-containing protein [Halioglobus sp.]